MEKEKINKERIKMESNWKDEEEKQEKEEADEAGETEKSLINNIKNFTSSASKIYEVKDYTSATILYFKALFSILDLIVFRKKGFIPKDHSERFRILEKEFSEFYLIADKYFPIYQSSYTRSIEKEVCDEIKENVERIIEEQEIL
ncbi:MAG: hypothetical protein AABX07_05830 [Nanoarchaeota archaeon]